MKIKKKKSESKGRNYPSKKITSIHSSVQSELIKKKFLVSTNRLGCFAGKFLITTYCLILLYRYVQKKLYM